jgi:hypothetical protein
MSFLSTHPSGAMRISMPTNIAEDKVPEQAQLWNRNKNF